MPRKRGFKRNMGLGIELDRQNWHNSGSHEMMEKKKKKREKKKKKSIFLKKIKKCIQRLSTSRYEEKSCLSDIRFFSKRLGDYPK
jgi:hypothetical protein